MAMKPPIVSRDPDIMGGAPVFAGTRVPVRDAADYLEAGDLDRTSFSRPSASVKREQVVAFLEQAKDRLIESAK